MLRMKSIMGIKGNVWSNQCYWHDLVIRPALSRNSGSSKPGQARWDGHKTSAMMSTFIPCPTMIWGMRWLLFVQVVPSGWPIVWLRGGRCKANNCITFILCRTLDFWHCSTAAAAGLHQDTGSCSINVRGCNHCRLQAACCMLLSAHVMEMPV